MYDFNLNHPGHVTKNPGKKIQTREELTKDERQMIELAQRLKLDWDIFYCLINKGQQGQHKVMLYGTSPADCLAKARKSYADDDDFVWDHAEIVPMITIMRPR